MNKPNLTDLIDNQGEILSHLVKMAEDQGLMHPTPHSPHELTHPTQMGNLIQAVVNDNKRLVNTVENLNERLTKLETNMKVLSWGSVSD